MPLKQFVEWVNAPGSETIYQEGKAGILQLSAHKNFSLTHTLDLKICKTTFYEICNVSSKIFPLVVAMWEKKAEERLTDFYSFDNNGICLSHGYSRWENGSSVINEAHDTDIGRLVEHGEVIKELIYDYPVPMQLGIHTTFIDLANNSLKK
ncbi:hypothetical protein GOV14_04270 [Candidatus Pacearchaeota archaeon]|nr:hypothetical protein [Candidatus Pacearchaeota archaeon]